MTAQQHRTCHGFGIAQSYRKWAAQGSLSIVLTTENPLAFKSATRSGRLRDGIPASGTFPAGKGQRDKWTKGSGQAQRLSITLHHARHHDKASIRILPEGAQASLGCPGRQVKLSNPFLSFLLNERAEVENEEDNRQKNHILLIGAILRVILQRSSNVQSNQQIRIVTPVALTMSALHHKIMADAACCCICDWPYLVGVLPRVGKQEASKMLARLGELAHDMSSKAMVGSNLQWIGGPKC
eukprot:1160628-Pelagomonas_calceolata.AAC.11